MGRNGYEKAVTGIMDTAQASSGTVEPAYLRIDRGQGRIQG